ncbi:MAG: hypothetical protein AB7P04_09360 [Bacteriovoracia bacterium]
MTPVVRAESSSASPSELTVFLFPSPRGIDWRSPVKLAWSAVWNHLTLKNPDTLHGIGHLEVELKCGDRRVLTGMTSDGRGEQWDLLFKKKYGFSILLHDFRGREDTPEEIEPQLKDRARRGTMSFITFQVSEKTCARLLEFYDEYKKQGYDLHYGLPNRPLYREGAGCTAYGAGFIEVAGLMTEEFQKGWANYVRFPDELLGGPWTNHPVDAGKLLFPLKASRWARANEPHHAIFYWDPDKWHHWIVDTWKAERARGVNERRFGVVTRGKAKGLLLDRRDVPTPAGPIFIDK